MQAGLAARRGRVLHRSDDRLHADPASVTTGAVRCTAHRDRPLPVPPTLHPGVHVTTTAAPDPATAPCTLRERKKQQTRQALHDAALTLVSEHGLATASPSSNLRRPPTSPRGPSSTTSRRRRTPRSVSTPGGPRVGRLPLRRGRRAPGRRPLHAHRLDGPAVARPSAHEGAARAPAGDGLDGDAVDGRVAAVAPRHVGVRTDEQTARTAVGLVMSALSEVAHRDTVGDRDDELDARLRVVVAEMGALASA